MNQDEDVQGTVLIKIPNFEGEVTKQINKIPTGSGRMDEAPLPGQSDDGGLVDLGGDDNIDNLLGGDDETPEATPKKVKPSKT